MVTAKHVFGDLDRQVFFVGRPGAKLIQITVLGLFTIGPPNDLDIAVVPLDRTQMEALQGLVFVAEPAVEVETDTRVVPSAGDEFIVFGFPDSSSQFRPNRRLRTIRQHSFYFRTGAADAESVRRENIDPASHLILDFDPERITVEGRRHNPPNPRGVSGGAAFHVANGKVKLASIMTEQRKASRVMVGVRMSEVVAVAQHVVATDG